MKLVSLGVKVMEVVQLSDRDGALGDRVALLVPGVESEGLGLPVPLVVKLMEVAQLRDKDGALRDRVTLLVVDSESEGIELRVPDSEAVPVEQ